MYYLIDGLDKSLGSLDKRSRGLFLDWMKKNILKTAIVASVAYVL
jgi:hypothetical protein